MFLADDVSLPCSASIAQYRMLTLLREDGLQGASSGAFRNGNRMLVRAGVVGLSKQVQVQVKPAYFTDDAMIIPIRWNATGAAGGLFPQVDANLEVASDGSDLSVLRVVGSYRPPFGSVGANLDRVLLNRVARATFRTLLLRLRDELTESPSDSDVPRAAEVPPSP